MVWLIKEGDIRRNGSWSQSKKGEPPSKQQKAERTIAEAVVKDYLNPLHCHHLSNEHDIPVAGEQTYLEKIKTKGKKERKKRERPVSIGWTSGQVVTRVAKRQRMEDELKARAGAAERAAPAVGHPNLKEELQWENRIVKLREWEDAALQGRYGQQVPTTWGAAGYNVGRLG